ncbi:conserved hypothetical protein [Neospora caninum Liverpool]|uniref:AMP-activated protein kinase glycogen-binding domain-containing protein n=1 Tax=Neospora caninum (strain Liverpool) TaxID=572307 RepID=F0VGK0_NEOCL|nr:conserved hypothetical protein [Neospora caninum Liverpool]CBZ52844.1 conserved hypothetical protein [Neospora caninum Liverpool]|eukprot:XP_003882876.1 conserved hypothetical protein [Neospora caninum Liverpool]
MSSSLSYSGSMAWNTGLDALESSSVRRYERSGVAKSGHVSLKQEIVMGESVVMQRPFRPSVEVSRRREAAVPSERPTETKGTDAPGETLSCLCSLEPSAFPGYLDATKRYGEEAKRDNKLFETVAIFREASSASKDGFRFAEVMADSGSTAAEGAAFRQSGTAFRTENVDQPSERCLPPTILESSATCTENTKTLTAEMCAVVERSCLRADASYGCGNSLSSSVFGPALVDTGRKIEEEIEQENRAQHDYGLFCEERQNASNEGLCSFGEDRECESETKGGTELSVSACWRRTTSPASSPDSGDFWDDLGDREATETTSPGERDVTEPSMEETDEEKQVEQSDKATEDTLECRVRENELKPKSEDQHHTGARRRFQLSNTECASPKVCQARIRHPEIAAKTLQRRWREHFMSAALEFEALVRCIRQIRSLAAVEVQRIYRGSRLRGILREEMHCLVLTLREEDIAQVNGERDACSEGPRGGRQGVRNVELVGAFGDRPWEERVSMRFCGVRRCYTAARPYTVGHHLFKFIVDGSYRCSGQYAQVADSAGNVNNCIDVADPVPPALCLAPRFPWPRARAFRRTGRSAASGGDSPLAEDAQNCGGSPSRSDGSQTASGAQRPPLSSAGAWSPTSGRSPSPRQVDPSAIGQADVGDTADEGDIEGAIPSCRLSTLDKESSSGLSRFRGCEAEGEPASDTCFETVLETARASKPFCSGNVQDARVTRGSLTCLAKKPLSHRTRHRQRDPRKRELSFATCPRRNPSAHPGETESHQPQQSRRSLVTGALVSFPPLYESGKGGSVHRESSAEAPQVPTLLSHPAVSARVAPLPGEARGRRQTTRRLAFEGPRSAPVVASGLDGGVASRTQGNGAARDRDESTGEAPNGDAGKTHTAKGSVPCGGSPLLLDALAASERDSLSLEAKYGSACTVRGECCPPEQDREESIKGGVSRGAIDRVTAKAGRGSGTSAEDTEGSNLQNEATPGEAGGACVCSSFDRVSFRTGVPKKHTSLSAPSISRLREKALRHREQVSSDLLVQGKEQFADAGLSAEVGSQPAGPEGVGASKRGGRHHPKRPADVCADLALSLVEGTCDRSRGNHGPNREGGTGAETSGKETLRGQEQGATEPFEVEEVKPVRRPCGRLPPLAFEKLLFTAALKIPEKCIHPAISHSIPIAWLRGVQEEPTRKVLCRVAALRGPTPSDSPHPRGMQELGGGR